MPQIFFTEEFHILYVMHPHPQMMELNLLPFECDLGSLNPFQTVQPGKGTATKSGETWGYHLNQVP